MKKITGFKTKGMNRDLSVSAFNPEFSFENRNLRLSTNESNTLMSWVNEKGTLAMQNAEGNTLSITGVPVGTAVINSKLVLFTHDDTASTDYIYVLKYSNEEKTRLDCELLFFGNLKLNTDNPLETKVSYEAENIQKVYWTDDINQPRVINIAGEIKKESTSPLKYLDTQFDFVPTLKLQEDVAVEKMLGATGMFAPGVIQYAFTYYNKYGQESNIFYTTPLQYISYKERGASPEDKVENAFRITVKNLDANFDYLRIYSIQRTSVDGTPICKRIQDIALTGKMNSSTTKQYVCSTTVPQVLVDGTWMSFLDASDRVHFGRQLIVTAIPSISSTPIYFRGFDYSTFSDLQVNTDIGILKWSTVPASGHIIWISTSMVTVDSKTGYLVLEAIGEGVTTVDSLENMKFYISSTLGEVSFIDTGTTGDSIDPTELLYKGGEVISAGTIEQKDGTLFLGNIRIKRPMIESLKKDIESAISITNNSIRTFSPMLVSHSPYSYYNQLTSKGAETRDLGKTVPCCGFKTGDYYRLGVQFQHESGKWSEPIHIKRVVSGGFDDYQATGVSSDNGSTVSVPNFSATLSGNIISNLIDAGYRKIRPVVVFPSMLDRETICQGVSCPTLYTENQRNRNQDLYAQSSWFFRPFYRGTRINNNGTVVPKNANGFLDYTQRNIESNIPVSGAVFNPSNLRSVEIEGDFNDDTNDHKGNKFHIDRSFRTLHSPDIEFDEQLRLLDFTNVWKRKAGIIQFTNTMSDIELQTETPTVSNAGSGFVHKAFTSVGAAGIVSGLFYDDYIVDDDVEGSGNFGAYQYQRDSAKFLVYPWQGTGSLNNDVNRPADKGVATSVLKKKIISNLRYSNTSLIQRDNRSLLTYSPQIFSSDENTILKLNSKIYKGNIDTVIMPDNSDGIYLAWDGYYNTDKDTPFESVKWFKTFSKKETEADENGLRKWNETIGKWEWLGSDIGDKYLDIAMKKLPVRMKYKSTPHLVYDETGLEEGDNQLAVIEICQKTDPDTRFGGMSSDALKENVWIPCGEPVVLEGSRVEFYYDYGDTYFQRYDCLKTYPFTHEDLNQIVEIGSFMLETHVNIDGRYDRNRGQSNNLNMTPQNFNLLNPVYSQIDNFFTYRIMDEDAYTNTKFPNQVTWTLTKESGASTDLWTSITLASILELDGDKGKLNKLIRFNNYLFAFQNTGISQILYNDNVQIQSTAGVPIEIANSGKVQGKDYKSDTIGCSNKWSMVTTPNGIYFMDSNDKSIYLFNGQLNNISSAGGFNSWCKKNIPLVKDKAWNPLWNNGTENSFVAYFDRLNQDVLFINEDSALAFSEKLSTFTSFYDYGGTPFFVNLDDTGIWIKEDASIWKHQAGAYCSFFDAPKPYWMTLVGNPEPQTDKIFTNIEFRASVDDDGELNSGTGKFTPILPFDSLETWNEYQHGYTRLSSKNGHSQFKHHTPDMDSSLKRKFRIWRCDIPRDNAPIDPVSEASMGIYRKGNRPHYSDRMRNPWLYLKLKREGGSSRTEVHDVMMTYFD